MGQFISINQQQRFVIASAISYCIVHMDQISYRYVTFKGFAQNCIALIAVPSGKMMNCSEISVLSVLGSQSLH